MGNAKYWWAVLYQENMRTDWEDKISELVQIPYAYCKHTKDTDTKSEHRKDHVHIILAFPNTTTYNHAFGVFSKLNEEGKKAVNKCEQIISIRNAYDYLIHDTTDCKKKKKYLYPVTDRIIGNDFDIGGFEQISKLDKIKIIKELAQSIIDNGFTDFTKFYMYVQSNYEDSLYYEVVISYSGFLERLTKGNYLQQKSDLAK